MPTTTISARLAGVANWKRQGERRLHVALVLFLALGPTGSGFSLAQGSVVSGEPGQSKITVPACQIVGVDGTTFHYAVPASSCNATVPAGKSFAVGGAPAGAACAPGEAGRDPLEPLQAKVRALVGRIQKGATLTPSDNTLLNFIRQDEHFSAARVLNALSMIAGDGPRYAMSTAGNVAPPGADGALARAGTVSASAPTTIRYACLDNAQLQQIWATLVAVARYAGAMAAQRASGG